MPTISEQYNEVVLSLQSSRNTIRNKLVELGIATSSDTIDKLADAIEGIIDRGAVSIKVKEGETASIPAGWHNGAGTVAGIGGGGSYNLQTKTATPTKKQQSIAPDTGYYGLSSVTVNPIPDAYQDVSAVTAAGGDVLTGKVIVTADGKVVAGSMHNNGVVNQTLDATIVSYVIQKGYHAGGGTIRIVLEQKTVTPAKTTQEITPTAGKVLSKVTVNPIPDKYQDVSGVTTVAENVLDGDIFVDAAGVPVEGTMPNNAAVTKILDNGTQAYTIAKGYHSGEGVVKIVTEARTATPSKSEQIIKPTTGKVINKVTVAPIPDAYQDVTGVTAVAAHVLDGDIFVDATGAEVEGTMPNNGAQNLSIDPLTQDSVTIPAGYTSGGTLTVTDDLLNALRAI